MPDQPSPYRSPAYAHALAALGPVLPVAPWGTGVMLRPIPGTGRLDAAGFYPLASLDPDADLNAGLEELCAQGLVSVVGVRDPHGAPAPNRFAAAFEVCRPFKTHFIIDRAQGEPRYSDHHAAEVRRAHRHCDVVPVPLADHADTWQRLYACLIDRHGITGAARFAPDYVTRLAAHESLTAFAAVAGGRIVGMALWLRAGDVAYNHLGATDAEGYRRAVGYALYDTAIRHFAGCRILNLGGSAGPRDADDGLSRFKRGFANATTIAHLFGAVLDRPAYEALSGEALSGKALSGEALSGAADAAYFPAYRAPVRQRGGTGSEPATGSL